MFSGIVEEAARVAAVEEVSLGRRLSIESRLDHSDTELGDSICVDGVCLTVVEKEEQAAGGESWLLRFDVASETLRCTTLGSVSEGGAVHLERSLQIGGRVHGHLVTGHVDGVAKVSSVTEEGETTKVRLELDSPSPLIARKGSVTLAGVSLTVGDVTDSSFEIYLIPHTKEVTRFDKISEGDQINIEFDMMARYVSQQLAFIGGAEQR